MNKTKRKIKKSDSILLVIIVLLVIFGLVMVSSAGIILSETRFGDAYHLFKRQFIFGVLPGIFLLWIFSKIHYTFWKKIALPFLVVAIFLLLVVFIPGAGVQLQGASRWINLGPIAFQPTELMKLALIVYLAAWLEGRGDKIKSFSEGLIPFVLTLGLVGILIILQPDVGTLGTISLIALAMFFVAGARWRHLIMLVAGGLSALLVLVKLEPYRMNRLLSFLNPDIDPQGIGYQIKQALIAIGSGGIFGLGLGQSRQKFSYLPEPAGDSIFAIISEELGMVGALSLLFLFTILAIRGYKIAKNAPDKFSFFLAFGITTWIIFQALINIMAIVALIPLTGITLPLISYGSTSLVFVMMALGVLLNISKYSKL